MRRILRAAVLATAATLLMAGVAQATVTSSSITSPTNGYYEALPDPPSPTMVTVTGTSNGTTGDHVDIRCWYGTTNGNSTLISNVAVNLDGSFSVPARLSNINGYDCRLRAEPAGDTTESSAFTGPNIAVSEFDTTADYTIRFGPNHGMLYEFYAAGVTFGSYDGWDSAGSYGPYPGPFDSTFSYPAFALDGNGSLYGDDGFSRSEIVVDGRNAYDVNAAQRLFGRTGSCTATSPPFTNCNGSQDNTGFPSLTVTHSWNPSTAFESTRETEGIVECTGTDGYQPANQAACPSFQSSGVQLQRSVSMLQGGRSVMMTDTWSSTDGHAHSLDLLYDDTAGFTTPGFQFPGETTFSTHVKGDALPASAAAPATSYVKSSNAALDGDLTQSIGAITFSSAPSGYHFSAPNEFQEHQTLNVPASGSATLSYIYSDGYTLAAVHSLALAAQDQFKPLAVRIASPGNGSRSQHRTITVAGTATAGSGISSLMVNGHLISVAANGSWQTTMTLKIGSNAITASAISHAGQTAAAHAAVLFGCIVPSTKGLKERAAKKRLRNASCQIRKVKKVRAHVKRGRVAGTSPGKGSKLVPGKKLLLLISRGP